MNCKSCGQTLNPGTKFCDKCGAQIEQPQPLQSSTVQQNTLQPITLDDISNKAKITAILAMVVSGLNLAILLILALLSDKIKVNWAVLGIQAVLLVLLSVFGFMLYKKINNVQEAKTLIRFRLFPLMGVIVLIGLLSGGGGIGILPLLILFFGSQTIQKIAQYEKQH